MVFSLKTFQAAIDNYIVPIACNNRTKQSHQLSSITNSIVDKSHLKCNSYLTSAISLVSEDSFSLGTKKKNKNISGKIQIF
jgi:hypothetical protein